MTGLSALVAAPWARERYLRRVAQVVERYTQLLDLARGETGERRRLGLILRHPGALGELDATSEESLATRLREAREEQVRLQAEASLPPPPESGARVRTLALADLTWLVLELRVLRRLARVHADAQALADAYAALDRPDPLPGADAALVRAGARLPGAEVRRRLVPLLALRYARTDLQDLLWATSEAGVVLVGDSDEIPEGKSKRVEAYGVTVAVFRHKGELFALDDTCPHRGGQLGRGVIDETGAVQCPLHAWPFDLATGVYVDAPNLCVKTYRVAEKDGRVQLLGPKG